MRKSKIAVVVFAVVIAAISAAKAETKVNFDGSNSMGHLNSIESIKTAASTQNGIASPALGLMDGIVPARVFVQDVSGFNEGEARLQLIRKNILKAMSSLSSETLSIVEDNKTIVCLAGESVFLIKPISGGKYNLLKELKDVELVKTIRKNENAILCADHGNKYWATIKKCYDVIVYVTTLVNGYEVAKPVVKTVCEMVQEWVDAPSTGSGIGNPNLNPDHQRVGAH